MYHLGISKLYLYIDFEGNSHIIQFTNSKYTIQLFFFNISTKLEPSAPLILEHLNPSKKMPYMLSVPPGFPQVSQLQANTGLFSNIPPPDTAPRGCFPGLCSLQDPMGGLCWQSACPTHTAPSLPSAFRLLLSFY